MFLYLSESRFWRAKRGMVLILIILIGLGAGGFFIYQNILQPETEKRETEEEVPQGPIEVSNTTRAGKLAVRSQHRDFPFKRFGFYPINGAPKSERLPAGRQATR